jgi:hypothetical protein
VRLDLGNNLLNTPEALTYLSEGLGVRAMAPSLAHTRRSVAHRSLAHAQANRTVRELLLHENSIGIEPGIQLAHFIEVGAPQSIRPVARPKAHCARALLRRPTPQSLRSTSATVTLATPWRSPSRERLRCGAQRWAP